MNCKDCPKNRKPYKFTFKQDNTITYNTFPVLTSQELQDELKIYLDPSTTYNLLNYKEISWREYLKAKGETC